MRRLLRPAAGIAVAVVVGLAAALLWRAANDDSRAPRKPRAPISVLTRLDPRVHGLGDPVVAEVVAVLDTSVIDPDTVRARVDYEPYDRIAPVQRTVTRSGSVVRFTFRYPLMCLDEACTPSEETPVVQLPIGTLFYRYHEAPRPVEWEIEWPEIEFVTRATQDDVDAGRWRIDAAAITPISYRLSAGLLALLLFSGSLGFLLVAALLAWQLVGRREVEEPEAVVDARPPLERALEVAHIASLNGALPERRRALERVARELTKLGREDLADRARTLAWSPRGASREAVDELARDARAALEPVT